MAVIDADKIGHQIYQPDLPAWREIVNTFGPEVLNADRTINRQALGKLVFADPEALRTLNRIVHPKMFDRMVELIAAMRAHGSMKAIVVEAAVLIEANWMALVDQVWVVVASEAVVVERLGETAPSLSRTGPYPHRRPAHQRRTPQACRRRDSQRRLAGRSSSRRATGMGSTCRDLSTSSGAFSNIGSISCTLLTRASNVGKSCRCAPS